MLVQKVTKNTHGGETLSMGFLPRDPLIRDDTKGGTPLWKPPHKLKPFCSTVETSRRTVRGRIQRGGRSPLFGRRGGGIHKGGTSSKGSLPYAVFWSLFVRTKSDPGCGAWEAPKGFGKKHISFPPARRWANQPCIGQMCRHRRSENGGAGAPPPHPHTVTFSLPPAAGPARWPQP